MTQQVGGFGRKQVQVPGQFAPPSAAEPAPAAPTAAVEGELSIEELKARFLEQEAKRRENADFGDDELSFTIDGDDLQILHVDLEPGQAIVAETGAMVWKDFDIEYNSQIGDMRAEKQGMINRLTGAGKRLLTGENLHLSRFTNSGGSSRARIGVSGQRLGRIIAIKLSEVGGNLTCEKGAFLAAGQGVAIDLRLPPSLMTGLAGGEGFLMQHLEGSGWAFIHAGGYSVERHLLAGERIHVDSGCVLAFEGSVDYNVVANGGLRNTMFSGEGFFHAALTGPGKVWIQTLPFARLAGEFAAASKTPDASSGNEGAFGAISTINTLRSFI